MSEVNKTRRFQWRYNMKNHAADRYWRTVVFFFLINVDNYIKWKPILWMQNSGFSIATRVYWSIWPQREGKCHFWGMCDILRSRNISINIWKCELWEVYLNFIKVYGQTLQNILEILHLYSKMKFFLSCFTKIKMKNKKDLDCFDWPWWH